VSISSKLGGTIEVGHEHPTGAARVLEDSPTISF
jgi:hypothetical protein